MTRDELTDHEIGLLETMQTYAGSMDLSGPRVSSVVRATARELRRKGLISGYPKGYELTGFGRDMLAEAVE